MLPAILRMFLKFFFLVLSHICTFITSTCLYNIHMYIFPPLPPLTSCHLEGSPHFKCLKMGVGGGGRSVGGIHGGGGGGVVVGASTVNTHRPS
jgi:hypothetical protein